MTKSCFLAMLLCGTGEPGVKGILKRIQWGSVPDQWRFVPVRFGRRGVLQFFDQAAVAVDHQPAYGRIFLRLQRQERNGFLEALLRQPPEADVLIAIQPVLLGAGIPLWRSPHRRTRLRPTMARTWADGLVELRYRRGSDFIGG